MECELYLQITLNGQSYHVLVCIVPFGNPNRAFGTHGRWSGIVLEMLNKPISSDNRDLWDHDLYKGYTRLLLFYRSIS